MNRPARPVRGAFLAAACTLLLPAALAAQAAPGAQYLDAYREVTHIGPVNGRVADVANLVLTRDAGRLTFTRGRLYLLSDVGGRLVGAVFRGDGVFAFAPPSAHEQGELLRVLGSSPLEMPITGAVLLFADSTPSQLLPLTYGSVDIPDGVQDDARDLVNSFKDEKEGSFDGSVIGPLLNGEVSGLFLARVTPARGDPLLFEVDPSLADAVQLYRPVRRVNWGSPWALVTEFAPRQRLAGSDDAWRARRRLAVPGYRIEARITESLSAKLAIDASATLFVRAEEAVGPWLLFDLHPKLEVDSARWSTGDAAPAYKADDFSDLWVRAPRRLQSGDSLALTVWYHGTIIDRFGNFFYIDPGAAWYPMNAMGRSLATFDVTFHTPARYPIVALGEVADSAVADRVRTTHWVTRRPTQHARFNLGLFDNYHVQAEGAPPLDIVISDDAHRLMRQEALRLGFFLTEQRHMRETVANDVSNSLKLFTTLFGEPLWSHFWVTEIPYGEGVSFPGMIDLSWATFQTSALDGFDEFFRAHEASHQWWGNGVRPGSYRDAWLSEGLASFSGLWYLQALHRRNDDLYRFLDQYRTDILDERGATGPIAIGFRNASPTVPHGYDVQVYEKGAWVFQMLRALMLDLGTMRSERFTETMRDYYQTYKGGTATTADFQRIVEGHAGVPMGWFFDEWVRGTAVPTYHVAWRSEPADGGRFRVRLRVTQEHVPAEFRMPVLVAADLGDNRVARFRVDVHGLTGEYVSPLLPAEPRSVVFNDLHAVLAEVKTEGW